MPFEGKRLGGEEIENFLMDREVYAFDPSSRRRVAKVTYRANGTCRAQSGSGVAEDDGIWGIEGDTYWTRYKTFRGGTKNVFFLQWVAAGVAQAFFEDGRLAFMQSEKQALDKA